MDQLEAKRIQRWAQGWNDAMFGRAPRRRSKDYLDGYFSVAVVA